MTRLPSPTTKFSRSVASERLYRVLYEELMRHGSQGIPVIREVIRRLSITNPAEVLKLAVKLIPSQSTINLNHSVSLPIVLCEESLELIPQQTSSPSTPTPISIPNITHSSIPLPAPSNINNEKAHYDLPNTF